MAYGIAKNAEMLCTEAIFKFHSFRQIRIPDSLRIVRDFCISAWR